MRLGGSASSARAHRSTARWNALPALGCRRTRSCRRLRHHDAVPLGAAVSRVGPALEDPEPYQEAQSASSSTLFDPCSLEGNRCRKRAHHQLDTRFVRLRRTVGTSERRSRGFEHVARCGDDDARGVVNRIGSQRQVWTDFPLVNLRSRPKGFRFRTVGCWLLYAGRGVSRRAVGAHSRGSVHSAPIGAGRARACVRAARRGRL